MYSRKSSTTKSHRWKSGLMHRVVKAKMVTFFKNGDLFHSGINVSYQPGKDFRCMDNLFDYLTQKLDLHHGCRYIFNLDGKRLHKLEELEDNQSYVVSGTKYFQDIAYGKNRNRGPYLNPKQQTGSNASVIPNSPRDGRLMTVINGSDHTVRCSILLNLRTTKHFEGILLDLGEAINLKFARRMYTPWGQEVRSFSQLKNKFKEVETFYIDEGQDKTVKDQRMTKQDGSATYRVKRKKRKFTKGIERQLERQRRVRDDSSFSEASVDVYSDSD